MILELSCGVPAVLLAAGSIIWLVRSRGKRELEQRIEPRSWVKVIRDEAEFRQALERAVGYEREAAGRIAERIARYESMTGAEVVTLKDSREAREAREAREGLDSRDRRAG